MKLGSLVAPLLGATFAMGYGMGCGQTSVPNPFLPDAGADGGDGGGGAPDDAGPPVDPTLGGPCVDDGQCDDAIDCTSDKCDTAIQRCRFTPDDAPCQNTVYCDGEERCDNKLGCVAGLPVACDDMSSCTLDACDEATHTCKHAPRDADLDGDPDIHCAGGGDCDDTDPSVSSKQAEVCGNGKDDNCNGKVDEAPCTAPSHDVCADPLEITAAGSYAMDTTGSKLDYPTSCGIGAVAGAADVVAALELPAGPPVDVVVSARTSGAAVSAAIAGQCGNPATEIACSPAYKVTQNGQIAKFIGRSLGDPAKQVAYPIYVATQPTAQVTVDVQILPASPKPTNETCGTADPVSIGVPFTASIFDCAKDLDSACAAPLGDLVYSFTLPATSDVDVYASSIDGDGAPMISLRDAACALSGDELGCQAASIAHIFRHSLPAGTYYVSVSASAPTSALVTVEASPPTPLPPDELCAGAPILAPNKTIDVNLAGHQDDINLGCLAGAADAAYELDLPVTSDVLLVQRIALGDIGGIGLALPACGVPADELACGSGSPSPVRTSKRAVPAGVYRVVDETTQGGDTEITAFTRPAVPKTFVPFADGCADALEIPPEGGLFAGNTANASADFEAGCDQGGLPPNGAPDQLLKLVLAAQKRVVLEMNGSSYYTLLDVRKGPSCPGDEVPMGCAVGYSKLRSYLDLTLDAGTYFIQVDGFALDKGPWLLDVRVVDP